MVLTMRGDSKMVFAGLLLCVLSVVWWYRAGTGYWRILGPAGLFGGGLALIVVGTIRAFGH